MAIRSDLERLVSLRDCGDLSQEEFEKAKDLLLSGENDEASLKEHDCGACLTRNKKELKTQLWCAALLTITWTMSLVAALINPSALNLVLIGTWAVAATLSWVSYFQKKKPPKKEQLSLNKAAS